MNKRHYEHTLPIIRGSLSNTYHYWLIDLFIAFNHSFHIAILKYWKIVLFQSCFPAFILSWNIEILQSRFIEILLSIILSWLEYFFQSCFQSWNPMQKKGEKTSSENLVPICPALSRFVHQPPILQHYKSPLLCSGVTNRRGRRCKTGLVNGWAYRFTLTPIRPWRISIFVRK